MMFARLRGQSIGNGRARPFSQHSFLLSSLILNSPHSIHGLEGVYVGNTFLGRDSANVLRWQSYMSFNKGNTWHTIHPPANMTCVRSPSPHFFFPDPSQPNCTLNLWGTTDTGGYADARGRYSAPGLVIGLGML